MAEGALAWLPESTEARPALVNGAAGVVAFRHGRLWAATGFTVKGGKIVEIDVIADPKRLRRLDLLALLDD